MLTYSSEEAALYFANNRTHFDDFYNTEKTVLEFLVNFILNHVKPFQLLDLGCGAGGLGNALYERTGANLSYTGIDINTQTIALGKKKFHHLNLLSGNFINYLNEEQYLVYPDLVTSFSCIDWNTDFQLSLERIISYCKLAQSDFMFTFRASKEGIDNIDESYQYVNYEGRKSGEIAAYVVLSFKQIRQIITSLSPSVVICQTTDRSPSPTAVTPYKQLTFGCMWIKVNDDLALGVDCQEVDIEHLKSVKMLGSFNSEILNN